MVPPQSNYHLYLGRIVVKGDSPIYYHSYLGRTIVNGASPVHYHSYLGRTFVNGTSPIHYRSYLGHIIVNGASPIQVSLISRTSQVSTARVSIQKMSTPIMRLDVKEVQLVQRG